jgi:molybdopterin-containing oxidoreductase family iron-sulfur binding subunit
VRRFNFLNYANHHDVNPRGQNVIPLKLAANPDVTVRGRGVMEKCTYCVQRINRARIAAKRDGRAIADGEVVTACQQACPTHAITFGNIADANSEVAKTKLEPHNYLLLEELNTTPRTSYLARVRNPNPALEGAAASAPKTE